MVRKENGGGEEREREVLIRRKFENIVENKLGIMVDQAMKKGLMIKNRL